MKEMTKNQKLKFEIFETAFSQTYLLLAEHAKVDCLGRQFISLVAEAYLFACIQDERLESVCLAATALTERMLSTVAFNCASDNFATSSIYCIESREEILLDFNDVSKSIEKLSAAYENAFRKKICG